MSEPGAFCFDDLDEMMCACGGANGSAGLDEDISDITFEELGYDSLAVLELMAKLQNQMNVAIPDNATASLLTPRSVIEYVNARLANGPKSQSTA